MRRRALPRLKRVALAAAPSLCAAAVGAQPTVTPSLLVSETVTDNVRLSQDKRAEAITRISPGIALSNRAGRVRGSLTYALDAFVYARESSESTIRHRLSASADAELVERWLFLDASASYSQQVVSALDRPVLDPGSLNPDSREVLTYRLSPHVNGRLPGIATYQARLGYSGTQSSGSSFDSTSTTASVRLNSDRTFAALGWYVAADREVSDFRAGRRTTTTTEQAGVSYALARQLSVTANATRQTTDLTAAETQTRETGSAGVIWQPNAELQLALSASRDGAESASVRWAPSVRTSLDAQYQRQIYGDTYSVSFEHRTRSTVWRVSDSRAAYGLSSLAGVRLGTVYELLFAQLASTEPDPVRRDALVRAYLQANGLSPDLPVFGNLLLSSASLQRRQEVSLALLRKRTTVTFSASGSKGRRLDTITGVTDDLSNGSVVTQRGFNVALSRRLTADMSATALFTMQRSETTVPVVRTELRSLNVGWTSRIGRDASVSVNARHVEFDSPASPYDENAIIATLQMTF